MTELVHDEKGLASMTLGEVVRQTSGNYPDFRFHPRIYENTSHYTIAGIDPSPYSFWPTADGIDPKPELAERLYARSVVEGFPEAQLFESLAFDTLAMIDGDEARFGRYMVGAANIIDMNTASNREVIGALARGLKAACDEGSFALLNGETAELGYRSSGYGDTRINWNAVGISVFNPDKLILGKELAPGQPVVATRENSIRSNGLTKARAILEADWMVRQGLTGKKEYVMRELTANGVILGERDIVGILSGIFGHDVLEQVLTPWHELHPEVTRQLLSPSRLYGPLMYAAQGKIDEPRNVDIVAAAHITGGGIPEKAKRMVENSRLGISLDAVFPDPAAVSSLLSIAENLPDDVRDGLSIDDRKACEQWNRGIGFLIVARDLNEAEKLVELGIEHDYDVAIAGKVIDSPQIQFRGHTWSY